MLKIFALLILLLKIFYISADFYDLFDIPNARMLPLEVQTRIAKQVLIDNPLYVFDLYQDKCLYQIYQNYLRAASFCDRYNTLVLYINDSKHRYHVFKCLSNNRWVHEIYFYYNINNMRLYLSYTRADEFIGCKFKYIKANSDDLVYDNKACVNIMEPNGITYLPNCFNISARKLTVLTYLDNEIDFFSSYFGPSLGSNIKIKNSLIATISMTDRKKVSVLKKLKKNSFYLLAVLYNEHNVISADFSPDNKLLVTVSVDGIARIWQIQKNILDLMPNNIIDLEQLLFLKLLNYCYLYRPRVSIPDIVHNFYEKLVLNLNNRTVSKYLNDILDSFGQNLKEAIIKRFRIAGLYTSLDNYTGCIVQ